MARHPDWFERLDAISDLVRRADQLEWLGRHEIKAIFGCSERDSIRLLHRFGAEEHGNALTLPRSSLWAQLEAIRAGSTYAAYLRQRSNVVGQLTAARAEAAARQLRIRPEERLAGLQDLPKTIAWRRGRFEIVYRDGADLMSQLADFLRAAGINREEFFAGTEPDDGEIRGV